MAHPITRRAVDAAVAAGPAEDLTTLTPEELCLCLIRGAFAADELARRMDRTGWTADANELRIIAARLRDEAEIAATEVPA